MHSMILAFIGCLFLSEIWGNALMKRDNHLMIFSSGAGSFKQMLEWRWSDITYVYLLGPSQNQDRVCLFVVLHKGYCLSRSWSTTYTDVTGNYMLCNWEKNMPWGWGYTNHRLLSPHSFCLIILNLLLRQTTFGSVQISLKDNFTILNYCNWSVSAGKFSPGVYFLRV